MRFAVLVEDAAGARKILKVKAAAEAALRPAIEKRGVRILRFAPLRDARPEKRDPAGPRDGRSIFTRDDIEEEMLQLEQALEDAEKNVRSAPVSNMVETGFNDSALRLPTIAVLAREAVRRIAAGRTFAEILGFLMETAKVPENLARMIIGMAVDTGKVALEIEAGKRTKEEGIRLIQKKAQGAEEIMVRPVLDRILPLAGDLNPKAFLARLRGFK